jgi:DNA-binding NtrC family response regulator
MYRCISAKRENAGSVIKALLVSPVESDHAVLREAFADRSWKLYSASSCTEALNVIRRASIPVVICERNLRDGNWKTLLAASARVPQPPRLVVSSPSADLELFGEVRCKGGYSVLSSPFDAREIDVQVKLAWHSWHRQWRNLRSASLVT